MREKLACVEVAYMFFFFFFLFFFFFFFFSFCISSASQLCFEFLHSFSSSTVASLQSGSGGCFFFPFSLGINWISGGVRVFKIPLVLEWVFFLLLALRSI
jgi:hypothetical protein